MAVSWLCQRTDRPNKTAAKPRRNPRRKPRPPPFCNVRIHVYVFMLKKGWVSWFSSGGSWRFRGGFAPVSVGVALLTRRQSQRNRDETPKENLETQHFFNVRLHVYFFMLKKGWVSRFSSGGFVAFPWRFRAGFAGFCLVGACIGIEKPPSNKPRNATFA